MYNRRVCFNASRLKRVLLEAVGTQDKKKDLKSQIKIPEILTNKTDSFRN